MIELSVVIPSYNRRGPLLRALDALARHDYPPDRFEVIVALDGGRDDSRPALAATRFPFDLQVVAFDRSRGAAAARNLGARRARGRLLVFLDDDIQALPGLLAAHARAHGSGVAVSTGYLRTATTCSAARRGIPRSASPDADFFRIALRNWWEAMFQAMRRVGHRYNFRDVLTGNCAIDADLFRDVGGFDERLQCHEDYEIGVRMLDARAEFAFVEDAAAVHHECTTLERALGRKRNEGRADVEMLRRHPRLVGVLPLGVFEQHATRMEALIRRLVFERPAAARLLADALARSLRPLEAARLRGRWQRKLHQLLHYWYWRGVVDRLPDFGEFERFRAACRADPAWRPASLVIDLAGGLAPALTQIDATRPDAVLLHYRGQPVGEIPAVPGAERLKGAHVKAALARELAGPLVSALGRADAIAVDTRSHVITARGPIPTAPLPL